ncbi:MAG: hypothetical protein DDT28_01082 [Dehalococcoidia bacterium]|nr:hypothetical protein [Chloroflexota bacterium]
MRLLDRLGESHEAGAGPYSLGQEILNMWQIQIQGFLDHLAHLAGVEPLGERIHRDQSAGVNQVTIIVGEISQSRPQERSPTDLDEFIFRRLEHLLVSKEVHPPAQGYSSGGGESLR